MKYVLQFARILAFCLLGELLHAVLPLPIPAGVYGLVLMLAALKIGLVRVDQLKETAHFLTGIFAVLFVPGAVGVIDSLEILRASWLPILIAIVPVTVLVFAAAGRTTQRVAERHSHE